MSETQTNHRHDTQSLIAYIYIYLVNDRDQLLSGSGYPNLDDHLLFSWKAWMAQWEKYATSLSASRAMSFKQGIIFEMKMSLSNLLTCNLMMRATQN